MHAGSCWAYTDWADRRSYSVMTVLLCREEGGLTLCGSQNNTKPHIQHKKWIFGFILGKTTGLFNIKTRYTDKNELFNMWHSLMDDPWLKGRNMEQTTSPAEPLIPQVSVSTDCDSSLQEEKKPGTSFHPLPPWWKCPWICPFDKELSEHTCPHVSRCSAHWVSTFSSWHTQDCGVILHVISDTDTFSLKDNNILG